MPIAKAATGSGGGARARKLFLAFDAFGTLFAPRRPVAVQYGELARRHGVSGFTDEEVKEGFRKAFKEQAKRYPNYGKAEGLAAPAWWANIIAQTFHPFLQPGQSLPSQLVPDLLTRFSTSEGYSLFPDVLPFFAALRANRQARGRQASYLPWPWDTRVGIITNSDDRIPGILESFGLSIGAQRVGVAKRQGSESSEWDSTALDVDFVVLSYDVGAEKPNCRVFRAAEKMFWEQVGKEEDGADYEFWYVGDEKEKDVDGALAAGWNAVQLLREENGHGRATNAFEVADGILTIHDLKELKKAIEKETSRE